MSKKIISFITALILVLCTIPVSAEPAVNVNIDGSNVIFNEDSGSPFIDSASRTQVPLRITMKAYGCNVDWNNNTRTAVVTKNGTTVEVPIGKEYILKNGVRIPNDTAAIIKGARTYLPIRAVLEAFGADVSWNGISKTVVVISGNLPKMASPEMRIHFVDVGQGDCQLIDFGEWECLIDAGNNNKGALVVNYIRPYIDGTLDYVVATHPDADHIGGLDNVLSSYNVGTVIDSGISADTKTYADYIALASLCNMIYDNNMTIDIGNGAYIKVIETGDNWKDKNDNSVVCELHYNNVSVLFTGDMTSKAENANLSLFSDVDVLKVGHHGSSSSSSMAFLNRVKPEYSIISCGLDNSYGHPHIMALNNLFSVGSKVLGTQKSGSIIMKTDGYNYSFNTSKYLNMNDGGAETAKPVSPTVPVFDSTYVGNMNSHIFHLSSCSSVKRMSDKNKISFNNRSDAVNSGYRPCNICNP